MMSPTHQSIEELESRIREAVASERYETSLELLAKYRDRVEMAYMSLPLSARADSQLPQRALDLCNWAHTLIRTSQARRLMELAQLDTPSPYLSALGTSHPSWQFEA
jgi:hypothetical protein